MAGERAARCRVHRRRRGKLTASRCAHCRKPIKHAGKEAWRARGGAVAIRCLDCRLAFCPRCAKRHFAPVMRAHDRLMDFVTAVAVKMMGTTCKEGLARGKGNVRAWMSSMTRAATAVEGEQPELAAELRQAAEGLRSAMGLRLT